MLQPMPQLVWETILVFLLHLMLLVAKELHIVLFHQHGSVPFLELFCTFPPDERGSVRGLEWSQVKRCLFKYIKLCTRERPGVQKKDRREGTYASCQYARITPGTTQKKTGGEQAQAPEHKPL